MLLSTCSRLLARTAYRAVKPRSILKSSLVAGQLQPVVIAQRSYAAAVGIKKKPAPATKTSAASKTKSKTTSSAKKVGVRTGVSKKVAPKKKVAAKKLVKKVVARAPAPKKPKKELTLEEKQMLLIKELKAKALSPPTYANGPSAWSQFFKEKVQSLKGQSGAASIVKTKSPQWVEEFRNLSESQREYYQIASSKKVDSSQKALRDWVLNHTPAEIRTANLARAYLLRIRASSDDIPRGLRTISLKKIPDDRYPKRPANALICYVKDKLKTYTGDKSPMQIAELTKAYKDLSEDDKGKYAAEAKKDLARYHSELRRIGIEPAKPKPKPQ